MCSPFFFRSLSLARKRGDRVSSLRSSAMDSFLKWDDVSETRAWSKADTWIQLAEFLKSFMN